MPSPSVSVVIPVRDGTALPLVLRALPPVDEVIVVVADPAGEAVAAARAVRPDARVVRAARPGPGAALASGVAAARGDIVITLNGDGSTDPHEIPRYVGALLGGADVVLGSRYAPGGRDLTGGRFRRWANQILIFMVNALTGLRRTDPGFGYAAFRRSVADRVGLPRTSESAPVFGDGPEIGPLMALRPSANGLTVVEIGSVAYPRIRRADGSDRARPSHWLRVIRQERPRRVGRHSAALRVEAPMGTGAPLSRTAPVDLPGYLPSAGRPTSLADGPWLRLPSRADKNHPVNPARTPSDDLDSPGPRSFEGDAPLNTPHRSADRRGSADPVMSDSRLWADRLAWDSAAASGAAPRREVGARRRRLQSHRERPDLRVINGEGTGSNRTRSGRLRAVPRKKPEA